MDDNNTLTAHNSGMKTTTGPPPKAEILAKSEAGISMEGGSKENRNITASTAERRPITTRMPEIVETSQQQY